MSINTINNLINREQGSVTSKEVNEPKTRNEPPPESPSERRDYREKRETNHKRGYRTETIKRIPNYTANDLKKPNGYMFTCNEHTMRECLEKQLFGNIPQALTDMQQFIVLLFNIIINLETKFHKTVFV